MSEHVIETVTFRLADGLSETDFLKSAEAASSFLKSCPGFVSRRLSAGEDGVWLDLVEWTSADAAKTAIAKAAKTPGLAAFLASAAPGSEEMALRRLRIAVT